MVVHVFIERCSRVFQLVFDMLVLQKHSTEMTTAAGEAFYTLVCLHQVLASPWASPGSCAWRLFLGDWASMCLHLPGSLVLSSSGVLCVYLTSCS